MKENNKIIISIWGIIIGMVFGGLPLWLVGIRFTPISYIISVASVTGALVGYLSAQAIIKNINSSISTLFGIPAGIAFLISFCIILTIINRDILTTIVLVVYFGFPYVIIVGGLLGMWGKKKIARILKENESSNKRGSLTAIVGLAAIIILVIIPFVLAFFP